MDPFWILFVGMAIVLGGILLFRLHAFLALTLAALAVGGLTPTEATVWHERDEVAGKIIRLENGQVAFDPPEGTALSPGDTLLAFADDPKQRGDEPMARLRVVQAPDGSPGADAYLAEVVSGEVSPGDRVLTPRLWRAAVAAAEVNVPTRVAEAFGETCAKIGILIAMAAIIGKCLLESGAADRVVRSAVKAVGESRAALAFLVSGFGLGIPVFFDTVFYLMIPLGKALRMRTGRNYLLYVLTIVAGATMAHSLVPPTPGPLLVAGELGVSVGAMIVGGCWVGLFTSTFGYFYAHWINRRVEIPLRSSEDISLEDLEAMAHVDESELPPTWLSILPIVLPVLLIGGGTFLDPRILGVALPPAAMSAIDTLSDKNIALILAAGIALLTLVWKKRPSRESLARDIQSALASGGVIILITAAGGAFGAMLKQTGIGQRIAGLTPETATLMVLPLAFGVTTLIRTAQGSATVAMITAVGILAPLAASTELGFHDVYLALAIGCGSKPIAWMNDSGFWVISRMSGMTEAETLKTLTPMTALMGLVGLAVVMLSAWLVPLA